MSNIVFSEKYQPLFEILYAWENDIEELKAVDVIILTGGRDSGKSFALSTFVGTAAYDFNHRILFTRQTMSSTDNSIAKALENRLQLMGIESVFSYASNTYTCRDPKKKGIITITGQKTSVGTQTAKLKSIEDYSIFITDEADEMPSYEEWEKVKRSIRAKDVQCLSILAFNPPDKKHWIYKSFFENVPEGFNGIKDGVLYIHTNYLDNGKENMAAHNWNEYMRLKADYDQYLSLSKLEREICDQKIKRNYIKYRNVCLGYFRERAEGLIYEDWVIGDFPEHLPSVHGLDFGSNDPDALTEVAVDLGNKKIYIREKYFQSDTSYEGLRTILENRVGYRSLIVADCAERRMIQDYYNEGFNIVKSKKKVPVKDQIRVLQDYEIICCPNSLNLQTALGKYRWHDKKSGVPNHDWSDLMDSWRYAAFWVIVGDKDLIEW